SQAYLSSAKAPTWRILFSMRFKKIILCSKTMTSWFLHKRSFPKPKDGQSIFSPSRHQRVPLNSRVKRKKTPGLLNLFFKKAMKCCARGRERSLLNTNLDLYARTQA